MVQLCIEKIHSPFFGMLDDNDFMRRVAYVMSDFGREMKHGGILQVSEIAFEDTKDARALTRLPAKYQIIYQAYRIDWEKVKHSDLKPFYSALAARLYMSNFPERIPPAHDLEAQAMQWRFK